jgi:hypothetical protein
LGTNDAAASAEVAPKIIDDIPVPATAAPTAAVRSSDRKTSGVSEDRPIEVVVVPFIAPGIGAFAPST